MPAPTPSPPYDLIDWPHYRAMFVMNVDQWASFDSSISIAWKSVPFLASEAAQVPERGGVYFFAIEPSIAAFGACYPAYAGKAEHTRGIRRRFREYLDKADHDAETRPKVRHLFHWWRRHLRFYYAEVAAPWTPEQVEDALLAAFVPPFNSRFKGRVQAAVNAFP